MILETDFALDELQRLLDDFSDLFGMATALLDLDGKILVASHWQAACTQFHRVNPQTAARCLESDTALASHLEAGQEYNVYRCKNGLVDVAVPVKVGGEHIANLFAGQFFFAKPNLKFFAEQSAQFQFESSNYLSAINEIPVFAEDRVNSMMRFLVRTSELIGEAALKRKELQDALIKVADSEKMLLSILDGVDACIYLKDLNGKYKFVNQAVRDLLQASPNEVIGFGDEKFFDAQTALQIRANDAEVLEGGESVRREEANSTLVTGEQRVYLSNKMPLRDHKGRITALCGISFDITELKAYERQLKRLAHFDPLTRLPNRTLLADRLQQAIKQCKRTDRQLAVLFFDLDNFKEANDRFGHDTGDKLLFMVADRLQSALREGDTLARLGGDEFVAVFANLATIKEIDTVIDRLKLLMSQGFPIQGENIRLTLSMGLTYYPQQDADVDAEQLVRQADHAMYFAKQSGGDRCVHFDTMKDKRARLKYEIVEDVRQALEGGQLVLHYQPKVNMSHHELVGVEALLRWEHPEKGLIPPMYFLPAIEADDLMIQVGDMVIDAALIQLEVWHDQGLRIPISVNVASRQLLCPAFLDKLKAALHLHPKGDGFLDLEIVETSSLEDLAAVTTVIKAAKKLGVTFSLDDFGTGYSSLTYLKNLPVDTLKIDQSFVRGSLATPEDLGILKGTIGLANVFGMSLVAEGVETEEHATMLLDLGCHIGQGYAFARPMPGEELQNWLRTWHKMHGVIPSRFDQSPILQDSSGQSQEPRAAAST